MSTSDHDPTADFAQRVRPAMPVDETTLAPMGSLPDIAMLTRLANEFFRAQPGQGFPVSMAPYSPDAQDMTPSFETRLPEFGMPLPSVPSIPSAGGLPLAPNVSQLSTGVPEFAPFTMSPAAALSPPAVVPGPEAGMLPNDPRSTGAGLPVSPFAMPMPEFGAAFPSFEAGVPALPPLSPLLTETDAKSALTTASPFYFLENAGGLN